MSGYNNIFVPIQHLTKAAIKPGGLCYAVFARWEDVIQWPEIDPVTGVCDTAIVLKSGATWYKLEIADNQNIYSETLKSDAGGLYIESKLSGYLGGNKVSHVLGSQAMNYCQFVLIFKDRDGITYLVGDQDSGAAYNYSFNSGDISSSRKRTVEFNWQSENGAVIYLGGGGNPEESPIIPPFQQLGDFSEDFNNDFNI
jgi:hypothetical protein